MVKMKTKVKAWEQAMVRGLALALFAGGAGAENYSFDGVRLEVPIPPGFCKLEEHGPDAVLRKGIAPTLGPELRLLFAVVDCPSLPTLRKDPGYDGDVSFGMVALMQKDGKPAPMKNTVRDLAVGQAGKAPERERVRSQVEAWMRMSGHPNVTERKELGIADVDRNGIYGLATVKARGRTNPALLVQTQSMTVVNGMGVVVTITEPVGPRTTVAGILAEQKRNLAALVSANGP
ncbi:MULTISPECIES: hypothetical protein [unclassified Variovorax]|uniref:hypothetical protein n=1 Tax=unclassified Variovorax TaxID=663243 RepID=UPI0008388D54|nr:MULTISPECIES: hypothetical protein [unclassified Variovorax]PNG50233.1 hypothetical protein CHC06_05856 [Variovorax sp. B2]PNG51106.1 hypothetical protein CHC07_05762 [Variovorax sp. B4]VTU42431.1 hypothetical protein SRS16P1_00268 [Variovorax sp. SRS16]VTU42456.1 hypothetical protein E5P1_00266 [Variovorax sp. PBL-E5]VTU44065.1 hypothetical protein H6P1_00663 [Variovorax sp. PBL-H6]